MYTAVKMADDLNYQILKVLSFKYADLYEKSSF